MSPARLRTLIALLVLGSTLSACRGVSSDIERQRLIQPEPAELFDPARIVIEERDVDVWKFREGEASADLSLRDLRQGELGARGLQLTVTGSDPLMTLEVDLAAGDVEMIDVDIGNRPDDIQALSWVTEDGTSPEEPLAAQRVGSPFLHFRFPVAGHPAWKGRIRSLVAHPADVAREFHLAQVRSRRTVVADERLAAALEKPWKFDLGREVRTVRLAPPGLELEYPITGGAGRRILNLAYGVPPALAPAVVEFEVLLETPAGRTSLFRDEKAAGDVWHTATVEFDPDEGDRLVFVTRSAHDVDFRRGLPLWASLCTGPPTAAEAGDRPNVILVSLDTLRADHMSVYGYPRATTPNIEAWAASKAVVFEDAIASAPWTLPSHASIFSGLDALRHGVNIEESVPLGLGLFTERLQAAGYTTAAFTGGGYLAPHYGFSRGFDVYEFWSSGSGEIEGGTERILELVEQLPQPFFLFFHTYEVHSPYRARAPYFEQFFAGDGAGAELDAEALAFPMVETSFVMREESDHLGLHWFARTDAQGERQTLEAEELPELVARYDSSIAYADAHLGRLFDAIESSDSLREKTAVIVTSDHGEALGDKDLGGHGALYDFVLRVPLVLSLPGGAAGGTRLDRQVRLTDIAPTILELAGVSVPPDLDGASLLPLVEGRGLDFPREAWSYAASSNYGVSLRVADRVKYIFRDTIWPTPEDREELYDLVADAEESRDLAELSDEVEVLRGRVRQRLEADVKGLVVTLSNLGDGVLSGSMHSNAFLISNFKTWDDLYDRLEWNRRTLSYEIPPRSDFELLVSDVPYREPIHLDGGYVPAGEPAAAAFAEVVVPHDMGDEWSITLFEDGWRTAGRDAVQNADREAEREPLARLRFHWRSRPDPAAGEVEVSPELREQLRALGYIDD